ncbi:MAG: hypothetical protein FWG50_00355 [Kiritimatiellaeota bacterium]|nr:hypothetical protein [Kiritimatiellota bacterium]
MNVTEKIINQEITHDIARVIQFSLWAEWCACPHITIAWWKTSREKWERTYHPTAMRLCEKHPKGNADRKLVAFLKRGCLDADHRQYFRWMKVSEEIGGDLDNGDTSFFWGHISGDATRGTATFHCYSQKEFCEDMKIPLDEACVFTVSHNLTEKAKQWLAQIETRALHMFEVGETWDIGNSPLARFTETKEAEV